MKKTVSIVILILILLTLFIPVQRLQLINQETGKIIKSFPIKNGEDFTVYFTHSVERTPWYEIYRVKDDEDIYLMETIFFSYGAGLPATTIHEFSIEKDGMHISDYNKKMDTLIYRVGAVIADHTVVIRGEEFHLNEMAEPFDSILFQAEKTYLYKYLLREVATIG